MSVAFFWTHKKEHKKKLFIDHWGLAGVCMCARCWCSCGSENTVRRSETQCNVPCFINYSMVCLVGIGDNNCTAIKINVDRNEWINLYSALILMGCLRGTINRDFRLPFIHWARQRNKPATRQIGNNNNPNILLLSQIPIMSVYWRLTEGSHYACVPIPWHSWMALPYHHRRTIPSRMSFSCWPNGMIKRCL